jgi:hypothetical protein
MSDSSSAKAQVPSATAAPPGGADMSMFGAAASSSSSGGSSDKPKPAAASAATESSDSRFDFEFIKMCWSKEKGHHFLAKKDIPPGLLSVTTLSVCEPYLSPHCPSSNKL